MGPEGNLRCAAHPLETTTHGTETVVLHMALAAAGSLGYVTPCLSHGLNAACPS